MPERSQVRRHPDDTWALIELFLSSHISTGRLSFQLTNLGDCTSSHSFLSTHAQVFRRRTRKGTLLSFPPLSFFHSKPAECLEQGAWPQEYLSGHTAPYTDLLTADTPPRTNLYSGLSQPSIYRIRLRQVHRQTNIFHPVPRLSVCICKWLCMCVRNDVHVYRVSFMLATAHKLLSTEWTIL